MRLAERSADADAQLAARGIVGLTHGALQIRRQVKQLTAARQGLLASSGQAQFARGALHQPGADPVLQLRQVARNHGPRQLQVIRRSRLAAQIDDGDEDAHGVQTVHDLPDFRNKLCLSIAFFVMDLATKLLAIVLLTGISHVAVHPFTHAAAGLCSPHRVGAGGRAPAPGRLQPGP
ncbi:hypothetical protein D3C71_1614930 [compost metagenome]